ncbi:MAG: hypothetical protein ACREPH_06555 [Rhodanobacteraceae bacterium]
MSLASLISASITCAALTANTLCGRPLPPWVTGAVYPVGIVLAAVSALWGVQDVNSTPVALRTALLPALVCAALWLAWLTVMTMLTLRGWRVLQQRPHPFLASE